MNTKIQKKKINNDINISIIILLLLNTIIVLHTHINIC